MADGDTRWIERGAYDLVNVRPDATASQAGLPKAPMLYGPIDEQLKRPDSFASQLQKLLAVRQTSGLYASRQILVPDVASAGLLVMVHELPNGKGTQVTALNFGATPIDETITLSRRAARAGCRYDQRNDRGRPVGCWRAANHAGRLRRKIPPHQRRAASQRVAMIGAFQAVYLKHKLCPESADDDAWQPEASV